MTHYLWLNPIRKCWMFLTGSVHCPRCGGLEVFDAEFHPVRIVTHCLFCKGRGWVKRSKAVEYLLTH